MACSCGRVYAGTPEYPSRYFKVSNRFWLAALAANLLLELRCVCVCACLCARAPVCVLVCMR